MAASAVIAVLMDSMRVHPARRWHCQVGNWPSGFGRALEMGAGFGIGDEIINSIF